MESRTGSGSAGGIVQPVRRASQRCPAVAAGMPAGRRVGGLGGQSQGPSLPSRHGRGRPGSAPSHHDLRREIRTGGHRGRKVAAQRSLRPDHPGPGRLERTNRTEYGLAVAHGRPDPPPSQRAGRLDPQKSSRSIAGLTGGAARSGGKRPMGSVHRCP